MGKIKKLHFNEIIGWAQEGTNELYPITSTMAVFDENNECLNDILKRIKEGVIEAKVLKIYTTVTSKPETPSNSTYNYATGILSNIESGWKEIKYASFDSDIWISDGVALKGTNQVEWGEPYKFSVGGENNTQSKLVRVYKNSTVKPETPIGGSYTWSSNVLIPPSGWSEDCDLDSLREGEYMWFSDRLFLMDNEDTLWSEPKIMFGKPETAGNVQVTVYAKSSEGAESLWQNYCLNSNGEGLGTFDFETNKVTFEAPLNTVWYQNIDNVIDESNTPIYSSTKNFYTNDLTKPWSSPIRYILPGEIIQGSASNSVSFGTAIYKAVIDDTVPSKPQFNIDLNQQFDFNKGQLVENAIKAIGWQLTPELAAQQLTNSKYIVYVSYNNYICDRDSEGNIIEDTIRETGWTDPIKYLNINQILQDVEQEAQDAANEAINNANADLTKATEALNAAKGDIDKAKSDIAKAKEFLGEGYTAFINGQGYNLMALMSQLATKNELTGYVTTSTFEQTANSIKQQISNEYAEENEQLIRTAVGEITEDYIRQQVTTIVGEDIVTTAQLNIKADEIKSSIASDINNSTTVIGQKIDQIRIAASNQAVTDITNKITTGEITVKPGNISLVAANGTTASGATSKAVFNLSIKDKESQAAITATTIVLNGETIADAIAAKYLNIDNFTYLFNKTQANFRSDKAMAIFGAGTSGTTTFAVDGSGSLAGGLVRWGSGVGAYNTSSNFGLSISGHIEARSGYIGNYSGNTGWEIGTLKEGSITYPALLGYSSDNNRLVLSTEFLESTTGDTQNWRLQKDGSGQLGRGNIAWSLSGSNACNLTIKGDTYIEAAYIGSGSDINKFLWLGTQNSESFISAWNGSNGILFTPTYLTAGAATRKNHYLNITNPGWQLNADGSGQLGASSITWGTDGSLNIKGDFTCTTYINSTPAWKLSKDGNVQLGGGKLSYNYSQNTLTVIGNITATSLTLGNNGATMNLTPYSSSTHGVATNGFSYIDEGEPILFGEYLGSHYCVPLLKMGSSSGVTYQQCEMLKISSDSITATSLAGTITGTQYRTTLYRVKEGSSWVYKQNSISGSNVTGTYISYRSDASPRELYQNNTTSHFSNAIYTGQNDQYKIRVFVISNGTVTRAYDTYIAKQVSISMTGSVAAGGTYTNYTVSNTWEYLNTVGIGDSEVNFLLCSQYGSTLSQAGPQVVTGLITSSNVSTQTLSGAYNSSINSISTSSVPFGAASGGISGGNGSSGTSAELVTSLTTLGSSTKTYACSAFNSLLYSPSMVNESYTTNTITINGVRYTIEICDSEPSTKQNNVIYLIKTT